MFLSALIRCHTMLASTCKEEGGLTGTDAVHREGTVGRCGSVAGHAGKAASVSMLHGSRCLVFPAGRRAPYPGGLPSYQEEQGGKGLGQYSSAFQQELSRPFHGSGSFQRHKDTPLAPEHQWSLSSA